MASANAKIGTDEAAEFLYHEADLLDEWRLEEWLDLFTDDGLYVLPMDDRAEEGPRTRLALIHDDALRRKERVFRLLHTQPPSQHPRSRTQHFVSNVRVAPGEGGRVVVRSAQLVCELRRDRGDDRQLGLGSQQTLAASCEHHLVRQGGAWRIALKKMLLLNRDLPIPNLTFII